MRGKKTEGWAAGKWKSQHLTEIPRGRHPIQKEGGKDLLNTDDQTI